MYLVVPKLHVVYVKNVNTFVRVTLIQPPCINKTYTAENMKNHCILLGNTKNDIRLYIMDTIMY